MKKTKVTKATKKDKRLVKETMAKRSIEESFKWLTLSQRILKLTEKLEKGIPHHKNELEKILIIILNLQKKIVEEKLLEGEILAAQSKEEIK